MAEALVSVIVPYFNAGKFIEAALDSVRRQKYAPLEIILVDDGSTDDLANRAKSWTDVKIVRQENRGPAAARNTGIKHATGEFIAFLDADDLWPEGKLALQVGRLCRDPSLDVVTGRIQYVNLPGAEEVPLRFSQGDKLVHVHLGAAVMRRRAFDVVGRFDETMRFHEDQDWYLRAREQKVGIAVVSDVTLIYQKHSGNMTHGQNLQDRRLLEVLKKSIDRRKAIDGKARNLRPFAENDDAKPLISVIIAVYNGASYLGEAIDSVLNQTWRPLELIVIDDGSTDESAQVAKAYTGRLRYHYQTNQGQGAARNAGVAMATGPMIAFLDADDVWTADKLSAQMALLLRSPHAAMVFGLVEQFHSPELEADPKQEPLGRPPVLAGIHPGTLLISKKAFMQVGLFPTDVRIGEFVDWYARAKDAKLAHVLLQRVVMKRRLHNNNIGITLRDHRHEYLKVLKAALDRRRET